MRCSCRPFLRKLVYCRSGWRKITKKQNAQEERQIAANCCRKHLENNLRKKSAVLDLDLVPDEKGPFTVTEHVHSFPFSMNFFNKVTKSLFLIFRWSGSFSYNKYRKIDKGVSKRVPRIFCVSLFLLQSDAINLRLLIANCGLAVNFVIWKFA